LPTSPSNNVAASSDVEDPTAGASTAERQTSSDSQTPDGTAATLPPATPGGDVASSGASATTTAADAGQAASSLDDVATVVVGPSEVEIGDRQRRADSLQAALALATQLPSVGAIELHFDGEHVVEPPLEIPAALLAREAFTVRAAEGNEPQVVFRPRSEQLGDTQRPRMIRMSGGALRWSGVHLRFELPFDDRQAWSLFYLENVETLLVERATLTIRNRHGAMLEDQAAFFELASRQPAPGGEAAARLPVTNLSLLRTSVRGQATLVRAERSRALQLSWQQGFFSSSQRLLDMGGLKDPPQFAEGIIRLDLRQLTGVVGPGLCRLRTDEEHPHQRNLLAQFTNCLLAFAESNAPVFEYAGVLSMDEVRARLNVSGTGNYYDNTQVILRVRSRDFSDFPEDVTLSVEDRTQAAGDGWYREVEPQPASMLNLTFPPLTEEPFDEHRAARFAIERKGNPMEMELPGFTVERLPEFPGEREPNQENGTLEATEGDESGMNEPGADEASAPEPPGAEDRRTRNLLVPPL
jgi:hypothetical protein